MQIEAYTVIIISVVLIGLVITVEYFYQRQEDKRHNEVISLLKAMMERLGIDVNKLDN